MALKGLKILVTDDEQDEQDYIASVLEDAGATIFRANTGDDALKIAKREQPHAVTLDISMPGLDVFHIMEELQNNGHRPDMGICIISGRPELRRMLTDKFPSKTLGFVDKPFKREVLLAKMEELCGD